MPQSDSPHPTFIPRPGPVVLCILDGVGLGGGGEDDAVATARTPNLDALLQTCPWRPLRAHGISVGLPSDKDMGNSEVGHNAMGAGRVFDQGAKLVDNAIRTGTAWASPTWRELIQGETLHLIGLVSDGNVHSHIDHLHALIERAAVDGVARLRVHVLTDGRDVSQRSALNWVPELERRLRSHAGRDYRIASGGGRMHITMDRYEADWEMVHRGWQCHVHGRARRFAGATEAIETLYQEDPSVDDQFLPAFVVVGADGRPVGPIVDGDSVLFFNFRGDRAIEISRAFEEESFSAFDRGDRPRVFYAGMMQYDGDLHVPKHYLVAPPEIDRTVGEYLASAGRRTFACSETQKFGHVTFFFNGNRSGRIDDQLETYLEIPSDRLPFEQRPWMKAAEIADAAVAEIARGQFDHIRLNFANGDMVGHTGILEATRVAVEAVDLQIGRLIEQVKRADGVLLITADHGNADEMWNRKGGAVQRGSDGRPLVRTSHTVNPVPFIVMDPRGQLGLGEVPNAGIASVGGTVLQLCGLPLPPGYLPGLVVAHGNR